MIKKIFKNYLLLFFLSFLTLFFFSSCKKNFVRPPAIEDLGEVRYLIKPYTHVKEKMILVTFDKKRGWTAMSTRGTIDGCDLSYLDGEKGEPDLLYNPCKGVYYSADGRPYGNKIPRSLPYYRMHYSDGHLYANTAKEVPSSYRFYTKELKKQIPTLEKMNKVDGVGEFPRVPEVLKGKQKEGSGKMFTEDEYIEDF